MAPWVQLNPDGSPWETVQINPLGHIPLPLCRQHVYSLTCLHRRMLLFTESKQGRKPSRARFCPDVWQYLETLNFVKVGGGGTEVESVSGEQLGRLRSPQPDLIGPQARDSKLRENRTTRRRQFPEPVNTFLVGQWPKQPVAWTLKSIVPH